ncbi:flagellar hook-length control protein FliK [Vibrio fluvialis]|uniref:flagellar hook-length control protein FliK n=1 Tax=Vibrio fluvialis TaxID=676 RepID=UPI001C9C4E8C|nr:flagellar hook-length control protein FliK [Vibrio fluvialis]EKO3383099.1 flagellar hook-length control protein FliK [Vibrio fluvialis]MBY8067382.1 flagellar hook-length control protein FliK [Vibrio fluvialis]MCG6371338.1 flagellar hook-length control protein FliK [Vibrio fluvialis]
MNVNSTSSVDNTKVTSVAKGAAGQSVTEGEAGDNSGFLSKLSALLFGSKSSAEGSDSESVAANSKSDQAGKAVEAENAAKSVDAVLQQGNSESDTKASSATADGEQSAAEVAEIPENLKPFIAKGVNAVEQDVQTKAAQAMSDGDELLGRLQKANQALAKHNGKTLPHEATAAEEQSVELTTQTKHSAAAKASPVDSSETSDLPVSAQLSNPQFVAAKSAQETDVAKDMDVAKEAQLSPAAKPLSGTAQGDDTLAPSVDQQAKADKNVHAISDSELAAMMAVQPASTPASQTAPLTDTDAMPLSPMEAAAVPWAKANVDQAQASMPGGPLSADFTDTDLVAAKAKPALQAQIAMAAQHGATAQQPLHQLQPAQQAVTQAQSAVSADVVGQPLNQAQNASPLNPAAAQFNPMLTPEMMAKTEALNPAALKAALGAKGLGGIEDLRGAHGSDGQLAHQVAAAAGQQGLSATQTLRADQMQPQQSAPLHLSKEMSADDMAERVQVMMSKNLKHVDIRLDPPELGRLHIRMNMHGDGASVQFTVSNQQARDALEHSMPRLREMLAQQGVQLADTSVQQQNSGQQQRYAAGGGGQSGQTAGNEHFGGEENLDTDVKLDLNVASKRDGISYYA